MESSSDRQNREAVEAKEQELLDLLAASPMMVIPVCQVHEQGLGNCQADGEDCTLSDCDMEQGFLTEFVVCASVMRQNGEYVRVTYTAPKQQLTHTVGLLSVALDEL